MKETETFHSHRFTFTPPPPPNRKHLRNPPPPLIAWSRSPPPQQQPGTPHAQSRGQLQAVTSSLPCQTCFLLSPPPQSVWAGLGRAGLPAPQQQRLSRVCAFNFVCACVRLHHSERESGAREEKQRGSRRKHGGILLEGSLGSHVSLEVQLVRSVQGRCLWHF